MKRTSRCLFVDWKALNGAAHGKRKLIIRENDKHMFTCPVKLCLHGDFKSTRGLRKHIDNKHQWYYYFDEQPAIKREDIDDFQPAKKKVCTSSKPAFSLIEGIGQDFLAWLCTTCGGGKNEKEARQTGNRVMKFFMQAVGNNESDNELSNEFVDCCLGSPTIIIDFLKTLETEWKLSSSASLNYVKGIGDMVDFRKSQGLTDNNLRRFTITEVYLRRARQNLRKKKNIECSRNIDLETLISRDSWASIEEMEEVIPFHIKSFKTVIAKCAGDSESVSRNELVFCIRFITTLLFLRVKCSRPMSFQFLSVQMINKARMNNGFIDQTEFKTASKYLFDTLILTDDVLQMIDLYLEHVRPRLQPTCEYLLVSTNGSQYQSLTSAMVMLVHQAIGKNINPTRYRQIIETESSDRLTLDEQRVISEDQKHSSRVAKVYYKKKQSRLVAIGGKQCMDKMTEKSRVGTKSNLVALYNEMATNFDENVLETSRRIIENDSLPSTSTGVSSVYTRRQSVEKMIDPIEKDPYEAVNSSFERETDMTVTTGRLESIVYNNEMEVNDEVATGSKAKKSGTARNARFTPEEDRFLKADIEKHGKKAWSLILKDKLFRFHETRTRDSLRMRADSVAFKKNYT